MRQPPSKCKFTDGNMAVDLEVAWDRWEDPGQYPSNMGAGPLPPGPWYPADIEGTVTLTLTDEDREDIKEYPSVKEWVNDGQIGNVGIEDVKITWDVTLTRGVLLASGDVKLEQVVVEAEKVERGD